MTNVDKTNQNRNCNHMAMTKVIKKKYNIQKSQYKNKNVV